MSLTIFDNYPEYKNLISGHVKKDVDEIIYAQRGRSTRRDFSGRARRPSKLFFVGEPGTGKTLTASIMIKELKKKPYFVHTELRGNTFHIIDLNTQMESRREEQTSYELIKSIENTDGFYLFYEPKVLQRSFVEIFKLQTQMEQIHEVLETKLQNSDSILLIMSDYIPPTNHSALLGFDEIIEFKGPSEEERRWLMKESLRGRMGVFSWDDDEDNIISLTEKLSHAEINILCRQALKAKAGSGKPVTETDLITLMKSGRLNGTNGMNGILNGLKKS